MQITKNKNSRIVKHLNKEIPKTYKKSVQLKPWIVEWRNIVSSFYMLKNWSKRGKYETETKAKQAVEGFQKSHGADWEFRIVFKH